MSFRRDPLRRLFFPVLSILMISLVGGCASSRRSAPKPANHPLEISTEPVQEDVPVDVPQVVELPPDPVDERIRAADAAYLEALDLLEKGDSPAARRAFDQALLLYLEASPELRDDGRLDLEFDDLVRDIHRSAVDSAPGEEPLSRSGEDLKEITAFLTQAQAVEEQELVRERSAAATFDVPIEINERVVAFIDAFSGPRKRSFEPGMVRSGGYVPMIRRIFKEEGIPQDLCYMAHVESAFKVTAYSRARARGMFQFISSTGRHYGLRNDWWVDMRADPELAARSAARYLKAMHSVYGDWYLALAEYNGGPRIRRAWNRSGKKADFWDLAAGRSLRAETRNYVPQIIAAIVLHKSPEKYGLTTKRDPFIVYDTVELDHSLDMRVAARLAGATLEEMLALNPGVRRMATPPDYKKFPLRVPVGRADTFSLELAKLPEHERLPWYKHRVTRGETLSTIAARYGASVRSIQSANSLRNPHRIHQGQTLMIPGSAVRVAALDSSTRTGAAKGERVVHRVRRGDTLYSIARRYGTSVSSIVTWNSLRDARFIRSGQRLVVYSGITAAKNSASGPTAARAGGAGRDRERVTHQVRRGDTLYSIARQYRVSVAALQQWNGLGKKTLIRPGDRLELYR